MEEDETKTQVEESDDATEHADNKPTAESMDASDEQVDEIMAEIEENPPDKLEDWPGGKAKYRTIGGTGDADQAWEDGPTAKLGPSDVVHHEGGDVSVAGERVDNPEDYKGEPIPGGPTDPDAPDDPAGLVDEEKGSDDDKDDEPK